jgi:hypothetical protein
LVNAAMQLTFTKTGKKHNWVRGVRRDGSEVSFPWPDTGATPPHDLVHCVVEQVFELRGGFWGLVDEGFDVARVKSAAVQATLGMLRDGARDTTELAQAEALVNYFTSQMYAPDIDDAMRAELLRAMFEPWHVSPPASFDAASEQRAREELRTWTERWHALPVGGSLTISFDCCASKEARRARAPSSGQA